MSYLEEMKNEFEAKVSVKRHNPNRYKEQEERLDALLNEIIDARDYSYVLYKIANKMEAASLNKTKYSKKRREAIAVQGRAALAAARAGMN